MINKGGIDMSRYSSLVHEMRELMCVAHVVCITHVSRSQDLGKIW